MGTATGKESPGGSLRRKRWYTPTDRGAGRGASRGIPDDSGPLHTTQESRNGSQIETSAGVSERRVVLRSKRSRVRIAAGAPPLPPQRLAGPMPDSLRRRIVVSVNRGRCRPGSHIPDDFTRFRLAPPPPRAAALDSPPPRLPPLPEPRILHPGTIIGGMSAPRLRQRAGETLRLAAILPCLLVFSAVLLLAPPETRGATSPSAGRAGSAGGAAPQSASCTALIGGALIDTHADGENAAHTERSLGETLYADPNGNRWILDNVGNEIVSFSISGTGVHHPPRQDRHGALRKRPRPLPARPRSGRRERRIPLHLPHAAGRNLVHRRSEPRQLEHPRHRHHLPLHVARPVARPRPHDRREDGRRRADRRQPRPGRTRRALAHLGSGEYRHQPDQPGDLGLPEHLPEWHRRKLRQAARELRAR